MNLQIFLRFAVIAVLGWTILSGAATANEATERKTAYCIGVIQISVAVYQSIAVYPETPDPQLFLELKRQSLSRAQRLNAYLTSRGKLSGTTLSPDLLPRYQAGIADTQECYREHFKPESCSMRCAVKSGETAPPECAQGCPIPDACTRGEDCKDFVPNERG